MPYPVITNHCTITMKFLILSSILTVAVLSTLFAQTTPTVRFTFNHVALSVADADASARFYAEVLFLKEITNRTEVDGIRWFSLGEDKELHLISVVEGDVLVNKAVHFAVTTPDFDAFVENLNTSNIPYTDWPGNENQVFVRADGVKQVYVRDPDGYWIEVNSAAVK